MWPRKKMTYHTLGTIYALVAIHTSTSIVIYSVGAICTVFARIRVTVVDIWKRETNVGKFTICTRSLEYIVYEKKTTSNFVLESLIFFFMRSHSSTIIVKIIVPENKDNYWTWQHFPSKSRLYSCKMKNSFSGRKWTHSNMVVDHWMSS